MKLLVGTKRGQGGRKNDFCWVNLQPAEIVFPNPLLCDGAFADDECGCARSLTGSNSMKGTTTAEVVEIAISDQRLLDIAASFLIKAYDSDRFNTRKRAVKYVDAILQAAANHKLGAVLEYRDGRFYERIV